MEAERVRVEVVDDPSSMSTESLYTGAVPPVEESQATAKRPIRLRDSEEL